MYLFFLSINCISNAYCIIFQPGCDHHRGPQESRTGRGPVRPGNASRQHLVVSHRSAGEAMSQRNPRVPSLSLSLSPPSSSLQSASRPTPSAARGRWRKWPTASPSWRPTPPASLPESTSPSTADATPCARDKKIVYVKIEA